MSAVRKIETKMKKNADLDLTQLSGFIQRLNIQQAAEYCQVSIRHLQEEITRGNLRAYKPGKFVLFEIDDLNKWIKKKAMS